MAGTRLDVLDVGKGFGCDHRELSITATHRVGRKVKGRRQVAWSLRFRLRPSRFCAEGGIGGMHPSFSLSEVAASLRRPACRVWLLGLAACAVFYGRFLYQGFDFPPYFWGEEARTLDNAEILVESARAQDSWWNALAGSAFEYNKGYTWLITPLYLIFGYDPRILIVVLPLLLSGALGAFFLLFRATRTTPASLATVVLTAGLGALALGVFRFKWHTVAYFACLAMYLYFLPELARTTSARTRVWCRAGGAGVFFLSCFFYFGCLLWAPLFGLLILLHTWHYHRRQTLRVLAACLAAATVATYSYVHDPVWLDRIRDSVLHLIDGADHASWADRAGSVAAFGQDYFSPAYLSVLLIGVSVAFWRSVKHRDRFALLTLTMLTYGWAYQLFSEGLKNPDQLNWSMIPLVGMFFLGAHAIACAFARLGATGRHCVLPLAMVVAGLEINRYPDINRTVPYQFHVHPLNTMTQGALVIPVAGGSAEESVRYYLPAPSVPEEAGGFQYDVSLRRVDYARFVQRVTFFQSEEHLASLLASHPGEAAVVFLSVPDSLADWADGKEVAAPRLLGQVPVRQNLREETYRIQYPVRRYEFNRSSVAVQPSPAAQRRRLGS